MGTGTVDAFDAAGLWRYRAIYQRTIDGDTLELLVDLGFSLRRQLRVRLAGFDAAERGTPAGDAARLRMAGLFRSERYTGAMLESRFWPLRVVTTKLPQGEEATSFERYVATVYMVGEDGSLTDIRTLLTEGS